MWAKFDDSYFENRKIRRVPGPARFLHMAAIVHCSQLESDGFFLKSDLSLIAAKAGVDTADAMVAKLIEENLLHDRGESYEVHDFLDYNPSHSELEAKRKSGAKRLRNWRSNGKRNTVGNATSNAVTPLISNGVCTGCPDPDLSLRDPTIPEKKEDPVTNTVCNSVTERRPIGHDLITMFGIVRSEVFPTTFPWNTARDTKGNAGTFSELLTDDEIADLRPTMLLALEKIKNGALGWTKPELTMSPSFAFGKWMSDFTGLREELHGRTPVVERPAPGSLKSSLRAGSTPENWEPSA